MKKHKITLLVELSVDVELHVADGWIHQTELFAVNKAGRRVRLDPKFVHSQFQRHIEEEMDAMDIAAAYKDSERE